MPDIRELPDMSRLDISDPYRVYELLPAMHKGKGTFWLTETSMNFVSFNIPKFCGTIALYLVKLLDL